MSPTGIIACGFLGVIAVGTILLMLPVSHSGAVKIRPIDALFTTVSAVCITGLNTLDPGVDFSTFGHVVILLLIQIGGLGITSFGAGLVALLGGRLNQRENNLVREALNYPTFNDVLPLLRAVIAMTFSIELAGAVMSFFTFVGEYPVGRAVWLSVFHSVASFNNAGFDLFGGGVSLTGYAGDVWMNITTSFLVLAGGFGFFAIRDLLSYAKYALFHRKKNKKSHDPKKVRLTLHTKVVLLMTVILYVGGGIMLKLTEGERITFMGALFSSMSARSAGYTAFPYAEFSTAGVIVMCLLMFIGANPGSTGGGMKTTTVYVLIKSLISTATGKEAVAFGKKLKDDVLHKSFVIVSLGLCWVIFASLLLAVLEPELEMAEIMFEIISALATVGLSMNVTPTLGCVAKLVVILTMYIGRLGPLTIATMWIGTPSGVSRPEEDIPIG